MVEDNDTLEENTPYFGAPVIEGELYDGQVWWDDGINPRKAENYHHSGKKLLSVRPSIVINLTLLDYILILFPMDYIKGTMIPWMNRHLHEGDNYVSEHEFIKWLGVWLVVRCYEGKWGLRDWCSKDDIWIGRGYLYHINEYMSRVRFEQILTHIKYTYE